MQSLSRSAPRLCRRPSLGFIASAPPSWSIPALARQDATLMAAASALANRHLDRLSRYSYGPWSMQHSGVRIEKNLGKPEWHIRFPNSITKDMDKADTRWANKEVKHSNPMSSLRYKKPVDPILTDDLLPVPIPENTSHRDGAIYNRKHYWKTCYGVDVTDRNETPLEPMRLSEVTDCKPDQATCISHWACQMMQIFSLKLAKTPSNSGPVQLYGFIGARDDIDFMLNYVFNRSRDDPITVQQGSLIEMTGPKRGISMISPVLIEFDMRIKNGQHEEDDLQLIDGMMDYHELCTSWKPFTNRIVGDCVAVDMRLALMHHAVEATVEVFVSNVQNSFSLSLSSFVSVMKVREEIQLFHGTIGKSRRLRRFVIAVLMDTMMHLKFKVGQKDSKSDIVHYCSFNAKLHGCTTRQIELALASISVKVAWSSVFE